MRIFKEEQRFNQLWIIILIVISTFVPLGIIVGTYIKNPSSYTNVELALTIGIILLASGLIFLFKLSTRIDEKGIHYKFFPFHLKYKVIKWNEIEKAHLRKYDAISEYGGWGLKGVAFWNKSKGTAINVSGEIGIQLKLKNEKNILIGTQKKEEAKSILINYKHKLQNG